MSQKKRKQEIQKHFYDEIETTFRGETVIVRSNEKVVARTKKYNNILRRERGIDRAINHELRSYMKSGVSRQESQEIVNLGFEHALQEQLAEVAMWACCADDVFKLGDDGLECRFDIEIKPEYWDSRQDISAQNDDSFDKLSSDSKDAPVITVNRKNPFEIMIAIVLHMVEEDEQFREDLLKVTMLVSTLANGLAEAAEVDEIGFLRQRVDESLSNSMARRNRAVERPDAEDGDQQFKIIVRKTENAPGAGVSGGTDRGASDQGDAVSDPIRTDSDEPKPISEGVESPQS